jgi:hypothetical protein
MDDWEIDGRPVLPRGRGVGVSRSGDIKERLGDGECAQASGLADLASTFLGNQALSAAVDQGPQWHFWVNSQFPPLRRVSVSEALRLVTDPDRRQ